MSGKIKIELWNRLHFKIAFFVIATIVGIFAAFTAYQLHSYRQQLTILETHSAEELCRTLISSLEIAMLNSDLHAIQNSIEVVARDDHIASVMLLNMAGNVRAASDTTMIGRTFSRDDEGCRSCHSVSDPEDIPSALSMEEGQLLRVVAPVKNREACFGCHSPDARYNGVLVVDRSLDRVTAAIASSFQFIGLIAAIAVLLMMFLFRWYIKKHVINRVVYLESLATRVVDNELDLDIQIDGSDELASLARSFNDMKTSLRLSMERMDSHRNYLTNLLENLTDGILIIDDEDGVVYVNKAFANTMGAESSPLKPGDRLNTQTSWFSAVSGLIHACRQNDVAANEVITLAGSGRQSRHLEVHVGRLALPPWLNPETIIVSRDITARVMYERQVHQSEKLATVGRLAAGIAHEINNPMASILTCAEGLIKRAQTDSDDKKGYLEIIRNSARRCKMITQKLLNYSATSSPRMDIIDLRRVLQDAVALLQFEASGKEVALNTPENGALPPVRGCEESLVQLFVNLILNAIQAVDRGGEVSVRTERRPDAVVVYIEDNGPGISEEHRSIVFDPFFTTKPIGTGTGLGLSVSCGIVEQHGGQIEIVDSRPGFTSFRVSIPKASAEGKQRT